MNLFDFIDDNVAIDAEFVNSEEIIDNDYEDLSESEISADDNLDDNSLSSVIDNDIIPDGFNVGGDYQTLKIVDEDYANVNNVHDDTSHYGLNRDNSGTISFRGNGRCRVCGCGKWAGYGDTCSNCGHFYSKHI